MSRTIHNPIIKDRVTFAKTAEETDGAYSLLEIELQPGGGNEMHYHKQFSEAFTAVDGELGVEVEGETFTLQPGESTTVAVGVKHRFFNPTDRPIRFTVKLEPGSHAFEQSLRILYGLARDGKTNARGIPTKMAHLALLAEMSDTRATGILSLVWPLLRWAARRARKKGVDKELIRQYGG